MNQQQPQLIEGMPVYDMNGDKVGTISEHNPQPGCLVIHKGILFPKDLYIPLNAIQRSDADGVYLSLAKDDLSDDRYSNPPDTTAGYTTADTTTQYVQTDQVDTANTMGTAAATTNTYQDRAATETATDQDVRVPVMEEELQVGKRQEEVGRVHLHKDVVEEPQTVTGQVTREQVEVERVPVQGDYTANDADVFTEKDIDVPVMGEEMVVGKRPVVNEEVRLRKDAVTEEQQVSDTVRKERVTVEGADEVTGADTDYAQTNTVRSTPSDRTR